MDFQDSNTQGDTGSQETITEGAQSAPEQEGSKFDKAMSALKGSMTENFKGASSKDEEDLSEDKTKDDTQPQDWEKRYKDLQAQKDREVGEATKFAEQVAMTKLADNPEYIHELAKVNKTLADRIVKADLGEHGINSYDELMAALQKKGMSEDNQKVFNKAEQLEKKVQEIDKKLSEKEKNEAEVWLAQFKEQNPEFKGKVEQETYKLFDSSKLTLEECFGYIKWKHGIEEDVNQREERAFQNLKSKNFAGAITTSSSRTSGKSKRSLSSAEVEFLDGIGAKKTMEKHGVSN